MSHGGHVLEPLIHFAAVPSLRHSHRTDMATAGSVSPLCFLSRQSPVLKPIPSEFSIRNLGPAVSKPNSAAFSPSSLSVSRLATDNVASSSTDRPRRLLFGCHSSTVPVNISSYEVRDFYLRLLIIHLVP